MTYTAFRLDINNIQRCKEHLNNVDEVNEWLGRFYGKYSRVVIYEDKTLKPKIFVDDGEKWVQAKTSRLLND